MQLKCEANVSNRQSAALGFQFQPRAGYCQAVIFLCEKSDGRVVLTVCSTKNKDGAKHVLKNNVKKVFDRFVREGKATIQLVEPSLDIYVRKANQIELKLFLNAIKAAHQGQSISKSITTNRPVKAKDFVKPKTSMTISSPQEYRKAFPLPRSLEKIVVQQCSLTTINFRLLNLTNLTMMNLSHNKISHLPSEFGKFKHLVQLILAHNNLTKLRSGLFEEPSGFVSSLRILDVSHNALTEIPKTLSNCSNLVELHANDNRLGRLDLNFEKLSRLRYLMLHSNQLMYLDSSLENLAFLQTTSIHDNPWDINEIMNFQRFPTPTSNVATLQELAARTVRRNRMDISRLPLLLKRYISCGRTCRCGNSCFEHCYHLMVPFDISWICSSVQQIAGATTHLPLRVTFCSRVCSHTLVLPRSLPLF